MGKNRGFTLIELMVTIAVLAVIATMAAPSFGDMIARQKLNSTTRELVSTINLAKSQAALMRTTVALCLDRTNTDADFDADKCATAMIPGYSALNNAQQINIQRNRVVSVQVDSGVKVVSGSAATVLFNDVGSATTAETFQFCIANQQRNITVSRLGNITQTQGTC